jgi:hypothetical protein
MTFYLISAVLAVLLVLATWRVARMHREIRALRAHHRAFEQSMSEATLAIAKIGKMIDNIYGEGGRVLLDLGASIEEGRALATMLRDLVTARDDTTLARMIESNAAPKSEGRTDVRGGIAAASRGRNTENAA